MLLRQIAAIAGREPVVVTGDFNCREASCTYGILTGRNAIPDLPPDAVFRDAFHDSAQPRAGSRRTFYGLLGRFGFGRIDYIFVKNGVHTEHYAVLADESGASDHRPVVAQLAVDPAPSP